MKLVKAQARKGDNHLLYISKEKDIGFMVDINIKGKNKFIFTFYEHFKIKERKIFKTKKEALRRLKEIEVMENL